MHDPPQVMNILQQDPGGISGGKIAPVSVREDRLSMPDVIMSDDKNAICSQIFRKRPIPFNKLCHAMYDLQNGPALP